MMPDIRKHLIADKICTEIIRLVADVGGVHSLWYDKRRDVVRPNDSTVSPGGDGTRYHYVGRLDCTKRTYGYGGLDGYAAMELAAGDVLIEEIVA